MKACPAREEALNLLKKYNSEPFHIQHGLTVEGVMRWYANELGYGEDADFWATVGLLHDVETLKSGRSSTASRHRSCCGRQAAARTSSTPCAATAAACAATWLRSMRWRRCCLQQMS